MVSQFALCTPGDVRAFLKITDSSPVRDGFIDQTIDGVSMMIEGITQVKFVARDYDMTLDGSGRNIIWLPEYPILYIHTLIDDPDSAFSESDLVVPRNSYTTVRDEGDAGGIKLFNQRTTFTFGTENIKARWFAGYADLDIGFGENQLSFKERGTGTTYVAKIDPGRWDVFSIASMLAGSMSSLGLNTYLINYDTRGRIFRVTLSTGSTGTLQLLVNTANQTLPLKLGFSTLADLTGATGYAPATNITPLIPDDIRRVAIRLTINEYDQSEYGQKEATDVKSEAIGEYTVSYSDSSARSATVIPKQMQWTLDRYTRYLID